MSGWKQWDIGEVVEAGDFQSYVQDQTVQYYASSTARGTALGTAVSEGMVSYTADDNTLAVYNGSRWGQVAQAISPNYIINGAFDIWQRGTSFTPPSTAAQFNADRWYVERLTGATISQQAFTPADLTAVGFGEARFYMRIASAGATTQQILYQKVEDVRTLAGQTVTVSFYGKSATEQEYRVRFTQNFGSGGSADVNTSQTALIIGTSWARYTATFTLPSISGKTVGTGSSLILDIRDPSANAFTLDIWGVQLEAGSVATPFRRNANSIQGELAACQRYYQRFTTVLPVYTLGFAFSTTQAIIPYQPLVEMRTAPSATFDIATDFALSTSTGARITCTAITADQLQKDLIRIIATVASGLTAGNATALQNSAPGVTYFWELSAEL